MQTILQTKEKSRKKREKREKKQKKKEMCKFREMAPLSAFSNKSCSEMQKIAGKGKRSRKKRDEREKKPKKERNVQIPRDGATVFFFQKKKSCSKDFELGIGENRTTDEIQSTPL